ncbi:MAG: hypothetical protein ACYTF1_20235 [Planctomycetota bacterium]|jgi:hypothetical protein
MYQIESTRPPWKPRWTKAATAVLLVLTVGMAAALIQYKTRPYESIYLPDLNVNARIPKNWIPVHDKSRTGIVVHMVEPENKDGQSRQLIIVGSQLTIMENPLTQAVAYLEAIIKSLNPGVIYNTNLIQSNKIGIFPAWSVYAEPKMKSSQHQGHVNHGLGRVVVTQTGQIIGLILLIPNPPQKADNILLNKFSYFIEPIKTDTGNSIVREKSKISS